MGTNSRGTEAEVSNEDDDTLKPSTEGPEVICVEAYDPTVQ